MSENRSPSGRLGAPDDTSGGAIDAPKPRRPHRRTGRKPPGGARPNTGGARPGAGRPKGARDVLPRGTVLALNAARIAQKRLGEDAHPEDLSALQHVYQRVADVLDERVHFTAASSVLKAAAMAGDALAGPIPTKAEITGKDGAPLEVVITDLGATPTGEG